MRLVVARLLVVVMLVEALLVPGTAAAQAPASSPAATPPPAATDSRVAGGRMPRMCNVPLAPVVSAQNLLSRLRRGDGESEEKFQQSIQAAELAARQAADALPRESIKYWLHCYLGNAIMVQDAELKLQAQLESRPDLAQMDSLALDSLARDPVVANGRNSFRYQRYQLGPWLSRALDRRRLVEWGWVVSALLRQTDAIGYEDLMAHMLEQYAVEPAYRDALEPLLVEQGQALRASQRRFVNDEHFGVWEYLSTVVTLQALLMGAEWLKGRAIGKAVTGPLGQWRWWAVWAPGQWWRNGPKKLPEVARNLRDWWNQLRQVQTVGHAPTAAEERPSLWQKARDAINRFRSRKQRTAPSAATQAHSASAAPRAVPPANVAPASVADDPLVKLQLPRRYRRLLEQLQSEIAKTSERLRTTRAEHAKASAEYAEQSRNLENARAQRARANELPVTGVTEAMREGTRKLIEELKKKLAAMKSGGPVSSDDVTRLQMELHKANSELQRMQKELAMRERTRPLIERFDAEVATATTRESAAREHLRRLELERTAAESAVRKMQTALSEFREAVIRLSDRQRTIESVREQLAAPNLSDELKKIGNETLLSLQIEQAVDRYKLFQSLADANVTGLSRYAASFASGWAKRERILRQQMRDLTGQLTTLAEKEAALRPQASAKETADQIALERKQLTHQQVLTSIDDERNVVEGSIEQVKALIAAQSGLVERATRSGIEGELLKANESLRTRQHSLAELEVKRLELTLRRLELEPEAAKDLGELRAQLARATDALAQRRVERDQAVAATRDLAERQKLADAERNATQLLNELESAGGAQSGRSSTGVLGQFGDAIDNAGLTTPSSGVELLPEELIRRTKHEAAQAKSVLARTAAFRRGSALVARTLLVGLKHVFVTSQRDFFLNRHLKWSLLGAAFIELWRSKGVTARSLLFGDTLDALRWFQAMAIEELTATTALYVSDLHLQFADLIGWYRMSAAEQEQLLRSSGPAYRSALETLKRQSGVDFAQWIRFQGAHFDRSEAAKVFLAAPQTRPGSRLLTLEEYSARVWGVAPSRAITPEAAVARREREADYQAYREEIKRFGKTERWISRHERLLEVSRFYENSADSRLRDQCLADVSVQVASEPDSARQAKENELSDQCFSLSADASLRHVSLLPLRALSTQASGIVEQVEWAIRLGESKGWIPVDSRPK